MASNLQFRFSKGVATGSATPLQTAYTVMGGSELDVDQIISAGANTLVSVNYGPAGPNSGNLQAIVLYATQNCTLNTNTTTGTTDVQTISISGTPTGGTFSLMFGGQIATIAYNATASAVQAALQALGSIGSGNITCTGGPLPGTPVVCTFAGSKTPGFQATFLVSSTGLTGGSSPTVSVAHTTLGTPQDSLALIAGVPAMWDIASPGAPLFAGAVTAWYVTAASAFRLQARILTL